MLFTHKPRGDLRFNSNNVTSGEFLKRKSCDDNYPKLHLGQFNFLCDASPSRTPTWSRGTFPLYALVSLRTCLFTHSSLRALILPLCPCISRKNIPLRYLSEIVYLSRSSSIVVVRSKEVELLVGHN